MKKLTLIVAALALVMGFSQCKKDNLTPNDNRIQITLNANYGGNGSRTTFEPGNQGHEFAWNDNTIEYINVGGSQSGYLGQLNNNDNKGSGTFNGSITAPESGETLYFFYLGNGNHAGATTLDFSNQSSGTVTNWHIAIGSSSYTSGDTDFSATLNMAMAIAYFDLSEFGSGNIYLNGNDVYSTATVNYKTGEITGNSKGYINLGTAGSKYVALIPSVETETTLNFNSSSKTGSKTFLRGIKPASYYSNGGYALEVSAEPGSGIPGTFSVSATKKVFFSKGNLQYQANSTNAVESPYTPVWRFAEHQYDYIGNAAGNTTVAASRPTQSAWIDLFGWGTGNNPVLASTTNSDYSTFNDWGINTISNSDGYSNWRTLTKEEWSYLLNRTGKKGTGTVNDIKGIIILPDFWSGSDINTDCNDWTNNTFTIEQWAAMELAGVVFLPAAGYRNGTSVLSPNAVLSYWSSDKKDNSNGATVNVSKRTYGDYAMTFDYNYSRSFYYGCAVRLVRE